MSLSNGAARARDALVRLLPSKSELLVMLMTIAVLTFAKAAFAQGGAPSSSSSGGGAVLGFLNALPTWGRGVVEVMGSVAAVFTSLSALFGLIGAYWPFALKVAAACSNAGFTVHNLAAKLGSFLPGSMARRAGAALLLLAALGGAGYATSACTPGEAKAANSVEAALDQGQRDCVAGLAALSALGVSGIDMTYAQTACGAEGVAADVFTTIWNEIQSAQASAVSQAKPMMGKQSKNDSPYSDEIRAELDTFYVGTNSRPADPSRPQPACAFGSCEPSVEW